VLDVQAAPAVVPLCPLSLCLAHTLGAHPWRIPCAPSQVGEDGIEAAVAEHIVFVPDRPFNDVHYHLDSSKLAKLGWVEEVEWDAGLRRTVDW
jgi:UDP-glucose 4,6-dehydratase